MKFPYYIQLDSMDCGPTCFKDGGKILWEKLFVTDSPIKIVHFSIGVSMLSISDAAENIGFVLEVTTSHGNNSAMRFLFHALSTGTNDTLCSI